VVDGVTEDQKDVDATGATDVGVVETSGVVEISGVVVSTGIDTVTDVVDSEATGRAGVVDVVVEDKKDVDATGATEVGVVSTGGVVSGTLAEDSEVKLDSVTTIGLDEVVFA
jgi:hypothetical protein